MDVVKKLKSQAKNEYVSMSSLQLDRPYPVTQLRAVETRYGHTIIARLENGCQLCLPKSIFLSDEEIEHFNSSEKKLCLIYHGKRGKAYNFSFI